MSIKSRERLREDVITVLETKPWLTSTEIATIIGQKRGDKKRFGPFSLFWWAVTGSKDKAIQVKRDVHMPTKLDAFLSEMARLHLLLSRPNEDLPKSEQIVGSTRQYSLP